MKTKLLIIILICLICVMARAQGIGFQCGYGGTPTRPVILMDSLVRTSNYQAIKSKLLSNDNSLVCLSVIICEILESKGMIELSEKEKMIIQASYNSDRSIGICSGCTNHRETSMKNILNEDTSDLYVSKIKKDVIRRYFQVGN